MSAPLLDTLEHVETPEGISLSLQPAGPLVRGYAVALDILLKCLILILLMIALSFLGDMAEGVYYIFSFLLAWFYYVLFEVFAGGATPGKRVFKLRVVNSDGTPVNASRALIRNLLRPADFLPAMYGVGLLSCLANRRFQRLGDIAAGTVVVYREEAAPKQWRLPPGPATPPPWPIVAAEQRAIVDFAARAELISPARQRELAELLPTSAPPGTNAGTVADDGQRGHAAVDRLRGIARWAVGQQPRTDHDAAARKPGTP